VTKTTSREQHPAPATRTQATASVAGRTDAVPGLHQRRLFSEWSLASLGLVGFCGMQIFGIWGLRAAVPGESHATLARALSLLLLAGTAFLVVLIDRWRRRHVDQCADLLQQTRLNAQLREEKGAVYQLASYDHLTGLPNRMLFSELANSHLSRTRRSHAPFVMMFLDLDHFKLINDTLGHRIGDLLLNGVAQRLRNTVREADIVARLGGDEFVVLLTELESIDDVARVANKLIEEIGRPMQIEEHELEMRPSIGIAVHPRDGLDLDALMRNADSAMYEAKRTGRGSFRFYDPSLNSRSILQADLSTRFRRAILGDEFVLHYQPRISLNGYRITSLEALIRWQHPERGLVFPGEFIDYAEQEGLVVELGNWVLRETCRQIAAWLAAGIDVVPVAINVSPKQLRDQTFVNYICEVVSDYGIPANLLEIEITERCVVEDFERPRQALEALSELGLKIALDDYGTGFSSLSFLKRLPINVIKIDRSFISDIRNQSNDAAIVASTIALGHNLGLTVIAEGVETREQLIYLRAAGCDEVQGYYFQKPVPAADIVDALKAGELAGGAAC
jgi:diguanylate cyclase (GGDEF)-like protein